MGMCARLLVRRHRLRTKLKNEGVPPEEIEKRLSAIPAPRSVSAVVTPGALCRHWTMSLMSHCCSCSVCLESTSGLRFEPQCKSPINAPSILTSISLFLLSSLRCCVCCIDFVRSRLVQVYLLLRTFSYVCNVSHTLNFGACRSGGAGQDLGGVDVMGEGGDVAAGPEFAFPHPHHPIPQHQQHQPHLHSMDGMVHGMPVGIDSSMPPESSAHPHYYCGWQQQCPPSTLNLTWSGHRAHRFRRHLDCQSEE